MEVTYKFMLAAIVVLIAFILACTLLRACIKATKRDLLNDRDELIKRVDDPYKTDFWNEG